MKPKDIRELSIAEIEAKLRETRETLLQSNLRKHTGQIDKPHTFKAYRKDIARLETILTQKKQAAAAPAAAAAILRVRQGRALADPATASVTPMSNDAELMSVPAICAQIDLAPGQGDTIDALARTHPRGECYSRTGGIALPTGTIRSMPRRLFVITKRLISNGSIPKYDTV